MSAAEHATDLAETAMRAQGEGRGGEAERLLARAQALDPDAVARVLDAHDAAVAPDARDAPTADQEAGNRRRRPDPGERSSSYPGSTGPDPSDTQGRRCAHP